MATIASFVAKCNAWAAEVQGIGVIVLPPVGLPIVVVASAKVRASPDSSSPGLPGSPQPVGAVGTIKAGTVQTAGYWNVDFATGPDGWVWAANIMVG